MTYEQVRRRAQCGELEPAPPIDGKAAVSFRSVATLAARLNRPLDGPVDLGPFDDLRPHLTRFHVLGVERAAILRRLEADALEAEQRDNLGAAAVYWQLVAGLRQASYHWNADRQNWRVMIPDFVGAESVPSDMVGAMPPVVS